ncbi:MAG: hypothetical protein U1F67_14595 [Rubrivivax sp.]
MLAQTAAPGREAGDLRFATLAAIDRAHDLAVLRLDGTRCRCRWPTPSAWPKGSRSR